MILRLGRDLAGRWPLCPVECIVCKCRTDDKIGQVMSEAEQTADCVEGLRTALPPGTGLELRDGELALEDDPIDGWLHVQGPWGALEIPFANRRRVNKAALALMDRRFRERGPRRNDPDLGDRPRWMLFTEYVTTRQAHELRKGGIAFADTRGNVHLWGPGLYLRVIGNRPAARRPKTTRLMRPAAGRVLFALLQDPRRAEMPYRELAKQTGVAPDTVNRVFKDLEGKGYLKVWGTRGRAVTRLPELVELWTLAYEDALRPKLQPKQCHWAGARPVEELAHFMPLGPEEPAVLLGGEAAAAVLTDTIRPTTATLHVPPGTQRDVMKALDLVPRLDGPITLLHTFGTTNACQPPKPAPTHLADPLLVHAELLREGDDRARIAAEAIYDQYIVRRFPRDR